MPAVKLAKHAHQVHLRAYIHQIQAVGNELYATDNFGRLFIFEPEYGVKDFNQVPRPRDNPDGGKWKLLAQQWVDPPIFPTIARNCPLCHKEGYADPKETELECPECGHEWTVNIPEE